MASSSYGLRHEIVLHILLRGDLLHEFGSSCLLLELMTFGVHSGYWSISRMAGQLIE